MPICQICRSSHCGRVEFRPTSKFGLRIWPSALRDVASDTVKWSASCIYIHPNASPALASNVTFSVLIQEYSVLLVGHSVASSCRLPSRNRCWRSLIHRSVNMSVVSACTLDSYFQTYLDVSISCRNSSTRK